MIEDVKRCIDMRINFINQYFNIPLGLQEEVDVFFESLNALGEECKDATEFESRFAAEGYSDTFNGLYPRCTPKPAQMTSEDKKRIIKNTKDIVKENKGMIFKDIVDDATRSVSNALDEKIIEKNKEYISENDLESEYRQARNVQHATESIFGFFKRKKDR